MYIEDFHNFDARKKNYYYSDNKICIDKLILQTMFTYTITNMLTDTVSRRSLDIKIVFWSVILLIVSWHILCSFWIPCKSLDFCMLR